MAVASESAERIVSLPMESSTSKSAATDSAPSESSSPSTTTSSAAATPDRADLSNSWPNSNRYADIQSQALLRSEEYRLLFRLPAEEALIQDFNCAYQESILLQGHMYLFTRYICFYSNIFGFETKKIIPLIEVTSVKRAKTAGIFHNAIEIFAGGRKYFFASFLSRDEAFNLINDGWLQHCADAKAILEQQESIPVSCIQDDGLGAIEKMNSSKQASELDSNSRDTDASPSNNHTPSSTLSVENIRVPETPVELQDNVELNVESVGRVGSSSSTKTWTWNEEDIDAPEIQKSYTRVGETKFPIKVEEFFNLFFSDDSSIFIESFHQRCGDKEFRCSSWCPQQKFGYTREVSFQHPIKIYFGAKFGSCHEVQKFRTYRNSHMVIETSQGINDVPYGDYFRVEGLWDVTKDGDESNEGCILQIYVDVAFSKKTVFKGKIMQSTLDECREAYAIWINMAHELLKQKNLERQEEAPSTVMIQNGEVLSISKVKPEEAPERLNQLNGLRRRARTSVSSDVIERVDNHAQGNFINAASVTSLLAEYTTKFCTFLKSQSQISLIVIVAFVVIFLMQVSIVVLLNKPQNVHVVPSGDYYRGSSMGGLMGDRSDEAVAWLERRMHHLKDEMFMVESWLDRLRKEHNWLQTQLKDLDDGLRKGK